MENVINPDRFAATIHQRSSEGWFVLLRRHFSFAIFLQLTEYIGCGWRVDSQATMKAVVGQLIGGMARERLFADNAPRKKANGRRNIIFVKNGLM
ncbi:hypothetical protein CDAR_179251 [Caerostris darwini]|uniref:Uncharacterized protein n=1 Tax=Caerostris darwini TaxID=1538125 RepID=A0AAV4PDC7_9ARAC|nr:hypothetical protein CDAR_179251 [Caerostris darwini]